MLSSTKRANCHSFSLSWKQVNSKEKGDAFILAFWEELCYQSQMAVVKDYFTEPPPGKNVDRLSVITVESQVEIFKSRKTAQKVKDQQERAAAGQVKGMDTKDLAPRP